jgi:3-deoxy-7-phosphoheptulonate synthase
MVDFSHANSNKQYELQIEVGREIARQLAKGSRKILGVMIESHLIAGNQKVMPGQQLTYGQSITDACIGWDDTEQLLESVADAIRQRRANAQQ